MRIQPKGKLKDGAPECPHCKCLTNPTYKWYPALSCWSCGKDMWVDDLGRTTDQRRQESRNGPLKESDDDKVRILRSKEVLGEIKPVPCSCGKEPIVGDMENNPHVLGGWLVGCPDCHGTFTRQVTLGPTKEQAIKEWNGHIKLQKVYGEIHKLLNGAYLYCQEDGVNPQVKEAVFKAFESVQPFM